MIRWNASFIRGLAQSVLDRARTIRSGLATPAAPAPESGKPVKTAAKPVKKAAAKPKTKVVRKKTTKKRKARG